MTRWLYECYANVVQSYFMMLSQWGVTVIRQLQCLHCP